LGTALYKAYEDNRELVCCEELSVHVLSLTVIRECHLVRSLSIANELWVHASRVRGCNHV